jgi:mRNA-degrading endonuclease toxin of MazEF toxin-antitoxin module
MPNPNPQRGDIYWVNIPKQHTVGTEQYKQRPWLVISSNTINSQNLRLIVGVPLTTKVVKQNRQFRILISASEILTEPGASFSGDQLALTEQVRALAIERIEFPRVARVTDTALYAVESGLAFVLDMPSV